MKNKSIMKLIAIVLSSLMAAALICACNKTSNNTGEGSEKTTAKPDDNVNVLPGENTDTGKEDPSIKGETRDYGIFTGLFIPESMDFTAGTMIDPESEEGFRLADKDHPTNYIYFGTSTDPEWDIDHSREMNAQYDPQDISFELNGNTWQGIAYKYNGELDCFQIYTTIGDHVISVMSAGYPYDGALVKAVLASVNIGG
jgi:hypothetical protein